MEKHLYRLFRANAPANKCILAELRMSKAEANHFNEIMEAKDETAKWYKVD